MDFGVPNPEHPILITININIDFPKNIGYFNILDIHFLGKILISILILILILILIFWSLLGVCSCVENVRLMASLQDDGLMHGMLFALWPKTCRQQVLFLSRSLCKKG